MTSPRFLPFARLSAVGLALAPATAAGDEYRFHLVEGFDPTYQYNETSVNDINESAVGVGNDSFNGFLWVEGFGKTQLPWTSVIGINDVGLVYYKYTLLDPGTGSTTTVPAPSSAYPLRTLKDVNNHQVGVGVSSHGGPGCEPFDCPYDCGKAFVWDPANGSRHLDVPDLKALHVVNDQNVAVGVIIVNCDDTRGVVIDLDTGALTNLSELLPPIDLLGIPAQVWPTDIGEAGHVIGTATFGSEPQRAFVWTAQTGFTFLPTIPNGELGYMHVNAVNVHGHVVGEALDVVEGEWKGFVWDAERGIRLLEDLVAEPAEFQLEYARAINDEGWIAGSGHFGPGWATQRGMVLEPLAPPAGLLRTRRTPPGTAPRTLH